MWRNTFTNKRIFVLLVACVVALAILSVSGLIPHVLQEKFTLGSSTSDVSDAVTEYQKRIVIIRGVEMEVEVADTDELRTLGLSGRSELAKGAGMLFIFPVEAKYKFWMKDMHFAIDIIWLSADGVIVGITHDARPESFPENFAPPSPVRMVLEVPAGYSAGLGLQVGERIGL